MRVNLCHHHPCRLSSKIDHILRLGWCPSAVAGNLWWLFGLSSDGGKDCIILYRILVVWYFWKWDLIILVAISIKPYSLLYIDYIGNKFRSWLDMFRSHGYQTLVNKNLGSEQLIFESAKFESISTEGFYLRRYRFRNLRAIFQTVSSQHQLEDPRGTR